MGSIMAGRHENFSVFVTKTLNAIGYKWETIKKRRDFAKETERIGNCVQLANIGLTAIWAGSKREGVTKPLGGDSDIMLVIKEIIATETPDLFRNRNNLTVLKMETIGCPPGYTSLTPVKHGGRLHNLMAGEMTSRYLQGIIDGSCCVSENEQVYISSEIFIDNISKVRELEFEALHGEIFPNSMILHSINFQSRAGPSLPILSISCDNNKFRVSNDTVFSIPCHCPSIFDRFCFRRRKHGWPQEHVLQELSQLDAHVVPVGHKRSPYKFQEWRICFTKAEILLIDCLTEPQTHVFILLKLFAKYFLKEIWDVMTSYVMKNIILWIAELTPTHRFRSDTIVDRFLDCLFFLKLCVKGGKLPNYMISERNLLCHDTFIVKKQILLSVLDDCLAEKGSCLLRIPTLKEFMLKMYTEPALATTNGVERDETEHKVMSYLIRIAPEIGLATSVQDLMQLVLSGVASDLIQLLLGRISLDEFVRDPIGASDRMIENVYAHLQ